MLIQACVKVTIPDGEGRECEDIAEQRGHEELANMLRQKHHAVTDARDKAASAATAAAYAAAAADRKDIIPIVSPVEDVIAQGLVSLAIAGDIIGGMEGSENEAQQEDGEGGGGVVVSSEGGRGTGTGEGGSGEGGSGEGGGGGEGTAAATVVESEDMAYLRKNSELEAQLGDVERKLRLDKLYATRPPKAKPRVYF